MAQDIPKMWAEVLPHVRPLCWEDPHPGAYPTCTSPPVFCLNPLSATVVHNFNYRSVHHWFSTEHFHDPLCAWDCHVGKYRCNNPRHRLLDPVSIAQFRNVKFFNKFPFKSIVKSHTQLWKIADLPNKHKLKTYAHIPIPQWSLMINLS
jgi:hypothetical protein